MTVRIITEPDGSHTVHAEQRHYLNEKLTGLTAEQAVDLKRMIEQIWMYGRISGRDAADYAVRGCLENK